MQSTAKERAKHAGDYFTLLRHLLNYAYNSNINLPNAEVLLNNEIDWLKRIRVKKLFNLNTALFNVSLVFVMPPKKPVLGYWKFAICNRNDDTQHVCIY